MEQESRKPISDESTRQGPSHRLYESIKRVMDICLASFGLLLLSPIMLLVAVLIKLTSAGPAFLRGTRLGMYGHPFTILKFRTMRADYDASMHEHFVKTLIYGQVGDAKLGRTREQPIFKLMHDPRITPVGRFLRRTSIDELPLLINVLKGDMSIVGPRPSIPFEADFYPQWQMKRLACKPGITGLWQVTGRGLTAFDDMVKFDMEYIDRRSIWLDLKIIWKTFWVVCRAKGAY